MLRLNTGAFDAAMGTSASRWSKFTAGIRAGAFIAAEAFGLALVGSVVAATSFQKHMTESLAIMGNVTEVTRKKMEDAARSVAKTTLFSATQAADGFYFLGVGWLHCGAVACAPAPGSGVRSGWDARPRDGD